MTEDPERGEAADRPAPGKPGNTEIVPPQEIGAAEDLPQNVTAEAAATPPPDAAAAAAKSTGSPKKRRRWLRALLVVLALLLLASVIATVYAGRLIKAAIERIGPQIVGTGVHVDDVSITFQGHAKVEGLRVVNPAGFPEAELLRVEKAELDTDLGAYLASGKVVVEDLRFDKPEIDIRLGEAGPNALVIGRKAIEYLETQAPRTGAESAVIQQVRLNDAGLLLRLPGDEGGPFRFRLRRGRIEPLAGKLQLQDMALVNPDGYDFAETFAVMQLEAAFDPAALQDGPARLRSLSLTAPRLYLAPGPEGSNLALLVETLTAYRPHLPSAPAAAGPPSVGEVTIKDLQCHVQPDDDGPGVFVLRVDTITAEPEARRLQAETIGLDNPKDYPEKKALELESVALEANPATPDGPPRVTSLQANNLRGRLAFGPGGNNAAAMIATVAKFIRQLPLEASGAPAIPAVDAARIAPLSLTFAPLAPGVGPLRLEIASLRASTVTGEASCTGVALHNPAGYARPRAVTVDSVTAKIDPAALGSETLRIERMDLSPVEAHLCTGTGGSNLTLLFGALEAYARQFAAALPRGGEGRFEVGGLRVASSTLTLHAGEESLTVTTGTIGVAVDATWLRARLTDVVVGPPPGFHAKETFTIPTLDMVLEMDSLGAQTLVIQSLTVEKMHATYEVALGKSNVQAVLDRLQAFETGAGEGRNKPVLIRDFRLKESHVKLSPTLLRGHSMTPPVRIPDIHLENVKGGSVFAVTTAIVRNVVGSVDKLGLGLIKSLGGAVLETGKKTGEVLKKGIEGVGKGLKKLNPFHRRHKKEEETPAEEDAAPAE